MGRLHVSRLRWVSRRGEGLERGCSCGGRTPHQRGKQSKLFAIEDPHPPTIDTFHSPTAPLCLLRMFVPSQHKAMASKKKVLKLDVQNAPSTTTSTRAMMQDVTRTIHQWLQHVSHDVLDDSNGSSNEEEEEEQGEETKQQQQRVHQATRAQLVRNAIHMLRLRTTRSGCPVLRAFLGLGAWLLRPLSHRDGALRLPKSWAQPSALQVWGFLGAWNDAARVGVVVANGCASRTWRRVLSYVVTDRVCEEVAVVYAQYSLSVRRDAHAFCWFLLNAEGDWEQDQHPLQLVPHVVACLVACPWIVLPIKKDVMDVAKYGHAQGIAALTAHVNSVQRNDWLLCAAFHGHVHVVRYLCELPPEDGVFPGVKNNTAIIDASGNGCLDVVRYLCELPRHRGVDPGAHNNEALRRAVEIGSPDVARYLCDLPLHRGVDPSARGNDMLIDAVSYGDLDTVRYLCELPLARGVDPSVQNNAAIQEAATYNQIDMVKYLCELPPERGVNPGAGENVALRSAAERGHVEVVQYLCELPRARGIDPSVFESETLRLAAKDGHFEIVQYLCELPPDRGVNPAACENEALRYAAEGGHLEIVKVLCELPLVRGVDAGVFESVALRQAVAHGNLDLVRYLCELPLDRGVEPSARMNEAIAEAAQHSCEMVRYLCELPLHRGVDPGANKNRALQEAVISDDIDIVRYLCELPLHRGVDFCVGINVARNYGHFDIIEYLDKITGTRCRS